MKKLFPFVVSTALCLGAYDRTAGAEKYIGKFKGGIYMKRYGKHILCVLLLAVLLAACGRADQSPQNNIPIESVDPAGTAEPAPPEEPTAETQTFYGAWEIKDCQPAEISALSLEEAQAFRGYTITYQSDTVLLNDQTISAAEYKSETELYTEEALTQNYNVNLGEWWNGISGVEHVSVSAEDIFFGDEFFVADAETLWIYYEGVFFLAKRA